MTRSSQGKYYLIEESILSSALFKTVRVKELLADGAARTITEAVDKVGVSRSVYYKYKDHIFPFYKTSEERILSLSIQVEDQPGALSQILKVLADSGANILIINQGIPVHTIANVSIMFDTSNMVWDVEKLINRIVDIKSVKSLEPMGEKDKHKEG